MKHNSYFDGKVQSLSFSTAAGSATAGVIEPGKYSFSTSTKETMKITEGVLRYRLPGGEWKTCRAGEEFIVEAGARFEVEAGADTAYICFYG